MTHHPLPLLMWSYCPSWPVTYKDTKTPNPRHSHLGAGLQHLHACPQLPPSMLNFRTDSISVTVTSLEYLSWLQYDIEFHQWVAANRFTKWLQIHPQFYAYAFTAHGKATAWCPVCHLDGGYHSYDCPRFTFIQPRLQSGSLPYSGLFYPPHPILHLLTPVFIHQQATHTPAKRSKPDHCILFNKNKGSRPYGANCRCAHFTTHKLQLCCLHN